MVTSSIQHSQRRRVDTHFYRKCMIESYLNVFNPVFSKKVRVHKRLLEVCDWNISEFVWRNQLEVAAHQVPRWLHFWSSIQLGPAVEWLIALAVSSRIEADRFGRSELKGDIKLCFNVTLHAIVALRIKHHPSIPRLRKMCRYWTQYDRTKYGIS